MKKVGSGGKKTEENLEIHRPLEKTKLQDKCSLLLHVINAHQLKKTVTLLLTSFLGNSSYLSVDIYSENSCICGHFKNSEKTCQECNPFHQKVDNSH